MVGTNNSYHFWLKEIALHFFKQDNAKDLKAIFFIKKVVKYIWRLHDKDIDRIFGLDG